jgi:hypothetical protein
LMIDKPSGRVAYTVISFGGFMGHVHSHYSVPWCPGGPSPTTARSAAFAPVSRRSSFAMPLSSATIPGATAIGKRAPTGTIRLRTIGSWDRVAPDGLIEGRAATRSSVSCHHRAPLDVRDAP